MVTTIFTLSVICNIYSLNGRCIIGLCLIMVIRLVMAEIIMAILFIFGISMNNGT